MVTTSTWTTPGPSPKRIDPLVPTAIAELVLGTAFMIGGAAGVGVANADRHVCGALAGCFDASHPETDPLRAGAFSLGFGLSLMTSAGISLITTAARPLHAGETRVNGALATLGHLTTTLGVSVFVAGWTYGSVADRGGDADYSYGWPAFLTGSLLMVGGPLMLGAGAAIVDAESRGKKRARDTRASATPFEFGPVTWGIGAGSARATWSWR